MDAVELKSPRRKKLSFFHLESQWACPMSFFKSIKEITFGNFIYFFQEKWYLYIHFMTTFVQHSLSYSYYIFILSLLFLTNKKREKVGCHQSCHQIVVQISLPLFLSVVVFFFFFFFDVMKSLIFCPPHLHHVLLAGTLGVLALKMIFLSFN